MAVPLNIRSIAFRGISIPNVWLLGLLASNRKCTNTDAIDSFTSELVENKALKWKILNNKYRIPLSNRTSSGGAIPSAFNKSSSRKLTQIFEDLTSNPLVINIEALEESHIDNLLQTAIREDNARDVYILFDQLIDCKRLSSLNVLNMLFEYVTLTLDQHRLEQLINLCKLVDSEMFARCNEFLHFIALLQWRKGNLSNSVNSFKEALIKCNSETRPVIYRLLRAVIDETVGSKSEAVLLSVIEMGEFSMNKLNDEYLLCYIWESSFRSQWHSDQEVAKQLFNKHVRLREAVAGRISRLCFQLMQEFNIESIYQLMELFLKHQMLPSCRQVLIHLFEYQYWRRDLRACSEIIQNSIDLDIPLPNLYNLKLLDMLLGKSSRKNSVLPSSSADSAQKHKLEAKKYELKF
ncbi:uncharacterized protein LOC129765275 [Toxorhynchites rutilus septentrionalis]|uniref:uncharacterized protein LOC129765275 n=1 Tax=Toxorhynchites rutilus septentrionalis TaxID=329112 RepID=UPI00247854B1|nr:uncharacterized protein LOC129765275 [Toxorhynchites rutilus septentrionalis]